MDFSEDTQSSMNMDEDFWALPDILDIPASIFDAWLPDLEDHGGRTPLLEMTNPQGLDGNNGLEQSAVAVADFDIDSDALMGNLESIDIMQDISSPNWLHTFLDELDNEAISHSVRSHSSYYSRRRTRHTQLSSALLNRTPTESDHEQNIPLVVSATGTTPRVNGRYLHGLGKQCVENSERVMSSLMGLDSLQSFELELVENLATSRLDSGLLSRNICYSKLRDQVNNYETQIYEMKDGRKACLEESTAAQTSGTRQFKTRDVAAMETIAPSIDKWLDEVWTLSVPFITIQAHKSLSPPISPAASLTCRLIYLPRPPSDPNSDVPDDFEDSLFVVSSDQDDTYRYARSAAGLTESTSSCNSNLSSASHASHASWQGRKGRPKSTRKKDSQMKVQHAVASKPYWCTWCPMYFVKKSDWRRHEESQHAPQTEWICMSEGPEILADGRKSCAFCNLTDPDIHHLRQAHNQQKCLEANPEDRKFDRKDHLVQHLQIIHNIGKTSVPNLSFYQRSLHAQGVEPLWVCGFCGIRWLSWDKRYTHVGEHMKMGLGPPDWIDCVCVRNGYSPTLQQTLAAIGLRNIWEVPSHETYWCGVLAEPCYLPCDGLFCNRWANLTHYALGDKVCYHEYVNEPNFGKPFCRTVGIPEGACIMFWCGFCQCTFDTSDGCGALAYNCQRLEHFAREHADLTMDKHAWLRLSLQNKESFYRTAVRRLLDNKVVGIYPPRHRLRIAKHFARKLTEHQAQIGVPEPADPRKHELETSERDATTDGCLSKRPRLDCGTTV